MNCSGNVVQAVRRRPTRRDRGRSRMAAVVAVAAIWFVLAGAAARRRPRSHSFLTLPNAAAC